MYFENKNSDVKIFYLTDIYTTLSSSYLRSKYTKIYTQMKNDKSLITILNNVYLRHV